MKNWKVRVKLLVGFGGMAVFSLIIGFSSLFLIRDMTSRAGEIHEFISAIHSLDQLNLNCEKLYSGLFQLEKSDPDAADAIISEADAYISSIQAAFDEYASTAYSEAEEPAFYQSKKLFETGFLPFVREVHRVARETRDGAAIRAAILPGEAGYGALEKALAETINDNVAWSLDDLALTENTGRTAIAIQTAVMVLAFAAAAVLALYLAAIICKPLLTITSYVNKAGRTGDVSLRAEDEANIARLTGVKDEIGQLSTSLSQFVARLAAVAKTLEKVAAGDLSAETELLSDSDLMGLSLRNMVGSLNGVMGRIGNSTQSVAGGANEIAISAQNLANASMQQSVAVEELSGAVSSIAEKTNENAALADKSARLADSIMKSAETGSRQMDDMMSAVTEIAEASHNISNVIKAIDEIAFQTNILALNAAVEAARAGQHGKGFAVVADEVRSLAAKSAAAAKDTGVLILNTIEKSELGSRIAGETAASLTEIVAGISESNRIANEIANASKSQSQGIGSLQTGVDEVARIVQQNSATAEESAAAAQEMSSQSVLLRQLIAGFTLRQG